MSRLLKMLLRPFRDSYGGLSLLGFFASIALGIVVLIGTIALLQNFVERNECDKYAALTHAETYYSWSTPCLVHVADGRWVAMKSITYNNADVTVRGAK